VDGRDKPGHDGVVDSAQRPLVLHGRASSCGLPSLKYWRATAHDEDGQYSFAVPL
jgi:hypothetical protein